MIIQQPVKGSVILVISLHHLSFFFYFFWDGFGNFKMFYPLFVADLEIVLSVISSCNNIWNSIMFWSCLWFYDCLVLSVGYKTAIKAMEVMNHSMLNGRAIRVMWSRRDSDSRKSGIGNVFVKVYVVFTERIIGL